MMEDESWLIISSSDEAYDSDKIDSDIEAELYSVLHHGADTLTSTTDNSICLSPQVNVPSKTNVTSQKEFAETPPSDSNLFTTERKGNSSSDEVKIISLSSNCKKRKSDVLDNNLQNIQIESTDGISSTQSNCASNTSSNKKQRTNGNENLEKKSDTKLVLSRTVEIDSSDSDSIIWTEADEWDIKLETNLNREEVVLSSDSFSSDDSTSPFLKDYSYTESPANISQPSTSSSSNNSIDLWFVNSEDMYRSKSKRPSSRYHDRAVLHCSNCNLKGHSVKFCSVPKAVKCYICGGSHIGSRCKDKLCHKCFRPGHDSRFCNQRFVSICIHCNMRGHLTKHCPDLWRRYHLTTNERNIVMGCPLAQNTPIYCFNCGERGHYGAECKAHRTDRLSFPTWTSVIAYVHPFDTIQRANDIERNTKLGGIPVWSPTPTFRPIPQQQIPIYGQPPQMQMSVNRQLPPQMQMLINRQLPPQIQIPVNRQLPPQMQMPISRETPPQKQLPIKKKKNKKKKNNLANNLQTPPGGSKKKKNKANSASQTPESLNKKKFQKEVYFPRTPSTPEEKLQKKLLNKQKRIQRKQLKQQRRQTKRESFMTGLHQRLGLPN